MLLRQGFLQSSNDPRCDDPIPLDPEAHQSLARFLRVALVVTRMRGDGVEEARSIQGKALKIVQFPKVTEELEQGGGERNAVDIACVDRDQSEWMVLLVFDHKKTPIRQLPDRRRLVDAGQGSEMRWFEVGHRALSTLGRLPTNTALGIPIGSPSITMSEKGGNTAFESRRGHLSSKCECLVGSTGTGIDQVPSKTDLH